MDFDSLDSPFELASCWWMDSKRKMAEIVARTEGPDRTITIVYARGEPGQQVFSVLKMDSLRLLKPDSLLLGYS